jgi:hypothetical protein
VLSRVSVVLLPVVLWALRGGGDGGVMSKCLGSWPNGRGNDWCWSYFFWNLLVNEVLYIVVSSVAAILRA